MPGIVHAPDEVYSPIRSGGEGPKPSLWQNFDSNIELAQDRSGYNRAMAQADAYESLLDALDKNAQKRIQAQWQKTGIRDPITGKTMIKSPDRYYGLIWAEVDAARGKGQGFKAIPATQAEYDEQLRTRLIQNRNTNKSIASRAEGVTGWLTGFAGTMAGSLSDPINVAGSFAGGPATLAIKPLLTNVAINSGIEALTIPGANKELAYFDDKETLSEQVFNVAAAGVGGALLPVAIKGTAAGVSKAIDVVPWQKAAALAKPAQEALWAKMIGVLPPAAQRKLAGKIDWDALDDHLPDLVEGLVGRENLSVDEKLAVTMLRRKNEVEAANPYRPTGVGITAHNAAFDAHIRRVANDIVEMRRPRNLVQAATDGPSSIAGSGGQSTTITVPGKKGQVGFAQDIYQFFKAKGYTHEQARGIAAGIHAESASNHNIRGGYKGRALGIGQWLGDRRAEIIRRHGPNPTRQQQLEFLHEELQGRDAGGKAVLAAKDEAAVLDAYIRKFMRPAAGSQTTGDLKRGMSALGRGGESMTFREEVGGGGTAADLPEIDPEAEASAAIAARGAEIEAERAVLAAQEISEPPELRRDLFPDEQSWRVAQSVVEAEHYGLAEAGVTRQSIWEDARATLDSVKDGEVPGALYHPETGPIDVRWGDASGGYAHIAAKHPEVLDALPEIIDAMDVVKRSDNRIQLESDDHRAAVRLDWDGQRQTWLLTAFRKEDAPVRRSTDVPETGAQDGSPVRGASNAIADDGVEGNVARETPQAMLDAYWLNSRDPEPVTGHFGDDGALLGWSRSAKEIESRVARDGGKAERITPPDGFESAPVMPVLDERYADPAGADMKLQAERLTHDLKRDAESDVALYRIGDAEPRAIGDVLLEWDAEDAAIAAIKGCL